MPGSPTPLVIPADPPSPDSDDLNTPMDREPPYEPHTREPPSPRKRKSDHDEQQHDIQPRRLFASQPAEAYMDSQISRAASQSAAQIHEDNPFWSPPSGLGVHSPLGTPVRRSTTGSQKSEISLSNPISGTQTQHNGKVGITSRGVQTDADAVAVLEAEVTRLKRIVRARDNTIGFLKKSSPTSSSS